ncbi:MAG: TonB-dependent receptor [Gammaproteobacteria bacterium]|nr:TonB-dependent receptor [Gammaproteobacteria bacterium]
MHISYSAMAVLLVAPALVPAQEPTPAEVPPVIVSDTRTEQSMVSVPASIRIITRTEIERSGARSVAGVLRGVGGVQIADLFGDGSGAHISIRGFGNRAHSNTLVLVDGRRLNNPDIAPPNILSIPIKDIERIEVVLGSAGTLYGDQAVGGMVNIITRTAEKLEGSVEAGAGSYDLRFARSSVSDSLDNGVTYRLSGEKRASDNYRDHNQLDHRNLFARMDFHYSSGSVFGEYRYLWQHLEAPGALFADEVRADRRQVNINLVDDFTRERTDVERLGIRQILTDHWSLEAEATNRESNADFRLSSRFGPLAPGTQDRHAQELTPRLIGSYMTDNGEMLFTIGHDMRHSDYEIQSPVGMQRNRQSVDARYAQAVTPLTSRVAMTVGLRHALVRNDIIDSFTFPSEVDLNDSETVTELGLSFSPNSEWRLFGRRDENFRFAKVDEYTDPPPGVILKTQTGVSYELGAEWQQAGHSARMVAYRLDLDNEISPVPGVGAFGFPANTNIDSTRRDGLILAGTLRATANLHLAADYSYVDARAHSGAIDGNRVPLVPRHSGRISVTYAPTAHWEIFAEVVATGERVFSGDFGNDYDRLAGYGVTNLKFDYHANGFQLSARVNNLFNRKYSDFGAIGFNPATFANEESYFPSPKRNFWLTAGYRFQ